MKFRDGSLILLAAATLMCVQGGSAQANPPSYPPRDGVAIARIKVRAASQHLGVRDAVELARRSNAKLVSVTYAGPRAVGEVVVAPSDTPELITREATRLFGEVNQAVPQISEILVSVDRNRASRSVVFKGHEFSLETVEPRSEESLTSGDSSSPSTVDTPQDPNTWEEFYPSEWRVEGRNAQRCAELVDGTCRRYHDIASIEQSLWWRGGHNVAAWERFEQDWGFEFGVSLNNYSHCGGHEPIQDGWWLNGGYYSWATNVPDSARPYQDTNRMFDSCQSLSHELGIRFPSKLVQGARYSYAVSALKNGSMSDTSYNASMQIVHDDCPFADGTDCMGLDEGIEFPYGSQSHTLMTNNRFALLPRCARMHSGWKEPVEWSNGAKAKVSIPVAPYEFWDYCMVNEWY